MISTVKGEFRKKQGEVISKGADFSQASVNVTIDESSIDTNDDRRDTHLKSADFFDVENHKEITFKGTSLNKLDDENYQLKGILTIKNTVKEVVLDVEFGGINKDPSGNEKQVFLLAEKLTEKIGV